LEAISLSQELTSIKFKQGITFITEALKKSAAKIKDISVISEFLIKFF
jgi:hypothetical protein